MHFAWQRVSLPPVESRTNAASPASSFPRLACLRVAAKEAAREMARNGRSVSGFAEDANAWQARYLSSDFCAGVSVESLAPSGSLSSEWPYSKVV